MGSAERDWRGGFVRIDRGWGMAPNRPKKEGPSDPAKNLWRSLVLLCPETRPAGPFSTAKETSGITHSENLQCIFTTVTVGCPGNLFLRVLSRFESGPFVLDDKSILYI